MTKSVACFTGRFQPFHNQHLEVVESLSHTFDHIIIGVTNPDLENLQEHSASKHRHTEGANPFSYESRVKIINDSISGMIQDELCSIIPFDLTNPALWSVPSGTVFILRVFSPWEASKLALFTEQGFETLELPAPASKLSASEIRTSLSLHDSTWETSVVPSAVSTIQQEWNSLKTSKVSA